MNGSIKSTKSLLDKPITADIFLDSAFSIYIYMMTVANHTIFLNIAIVLLMVSTAYMCLNRLCIFMSWYFILELLLIWYSAYQIKSGIVCYAAAAQENINTLLICAAINFTLYNFIVLRNDFNKILSLYVSSIFFGMITLFVFGWKSLLAGRFLHDETYEFLGHPADASSNGIGIVAAMAFIICIYLFWKSHRLKCILINVTLMLCIFLTGSRKAIGLVMAGTFLVSYYMNPKKKLRNIMLAGLLFVGSYTLIMNVPIFYKLLGSRIENTINYFYTGSTDEASMSTRKYLIDLGVKYIKLNPIYGYGLANFSPLANEGGYYSHNNYIEILFSGGIIGFCIYYYKYVLVLFKILTLKIKKNTNLYVVKMMLLSLFIILTLLEYWFITYYERDFMILHILILGFCKLYKIEVKSKLK